MKPTLQEQPVECPEKLRLIDQYESAGNEYSRTIRLLNRRIGVISLQTYEEIRQATEQARLRCEQARLALEKHIAEHGCAESVPFGFPRV